MENDNTLHYSITDSHFIIDFSQVAKGRTLDIFYINIERLSSLFRILKRNIKGDKDCLYIIITDDFSNHVIIEANKDNMKIVDGELKKLKGNLLVIIKNKKENV